MINRKFSRLIATQEERLAQEALVGHCDKQKALVCRHFNTQSVPQEERMDQEALVTLINRKCLV